MTIWEIQRKILEMAKARIREKESATPPGVDQDYLNRHSYGGNRTIHRTGTIDIQVDWENRRVYAVWFRCLNLPFRVDELKYDDPQNREDINPAGIRIEEITYIDTRDLL